MGFGQIFGWGLILQVIALGHFIRRRPEFYWLFIILFLGPLGAGIYIVIEVVPDLGLVSQSFAAFPRRKRIRHLESVVIDNPSAGNFEELADLYMDEGQFARAIECYNTAIASSRDDMFDARYRRSSARMQLGDPAAALEDLETVVDENEKYDFNRAAGLLAAAYARTGRSEDADRMFTEVTARSTSSELYCDYAQFLADQQRFAESREWAERVLAKRPTMPRYLRRRERPWFRKATAILKQLPL